MNSPLLKWPTSDRPWLIVMYAYNFVQKGLEDLLLAEPQEFWTKLRLLMIKQRPKVQDKTREVERLRASVKLAVVNDVRCANKVAPIS